MPARGDGLAIVKWVTSFPGNPERGLPVVAGVIARLRRRDGRAAGDHRLPLGHLASHRRGRRGLGRWPSPAPGAHGRLDRLRGQRRLGRPLPRGRRLRAGGLPRPPGRGGRGARGRARLALGLARGGCASDVVVTVHPGDAPVILGSDLQPGQHLAVLGADGHGKARGRAGGDRATAACSAIEWEQASAGGELAGAGRRPAGSSRGDVTEIGAVLAGTAPGRSTRRGHPVRLDRAGDPGPRDRAGGDRGARSRRDRSAVRRPLIAPGGADGSPVPWFASAVARSPR